jgi:diacylglycerol kinase family enzyme
VLDVIALRADGAWDSVVSFTTFLRTRGASDPSGRIWSARGRTIRVEVPDGTPRPVQLDGELVGSTPFDVDVVPGALTVLVDPATVPGGIGNGSSNGR